MKKDRSLGLHKAVLSNRILISVGAGGTGKTTVSAAIGLLAARLGRRSLVMTIDPAHRLAVSLGLESLDHEQRPVPAEKMALAGISNELLYAMMLDQQKTFDALLRRHSKDEQNLKRVMANKLYKEVSTRLAGGEDYAAIEMVYHLNEKKDYDLLVLDTPPTANAFDFLNSPQKIIDALDSPVIDLLIKTYKQSQRFSFQLLSLGAAFVFRRIARFVGGDFLDDVAEFLSDLSGLLKGFRNRAEQVANLLTHKNTGFVIVTVADPRAIGEAIGFYDGLIQRKMNPVGFVINRVHTVEKVNWTENELVAKIEKMGLSKDQASLLAPTLLSAHKKISILAKTDGEQIQRLKKHCGDNYPYVQVPLFDEDVYDIKGLAKFSEYLSS